MPTLEERVAYLEGKVEELSGGYTQLRHDIHALDQKVDRFREELSARIDALDQKVDRFREELSARIDALDQKVDRFREELAGEIRSLDQKFSRWFAWLTGILVTALLAQLGLLGAALFRR
ncbi:MAG: hypothetical protein QN193_03405 [Armatimonadota bacterium]|nr:hypothetical protein [Armatimonadota bacterium]MDR7569636.1 hypothetical protein [Armatimonadota bacterium]MDR7614690.1 hypothetical protein [Armatimonadota bacterium]